MQQPKHIVIVDAIAYPGGSKVATNSLLATFNRDAVNVTIVTNDPASWSEHHRIIRLLEIPWLAAQEQGLCYFFRHLLLALHLLVARLRYGTIDVALGASNPGVDLSLYLAQPLLRFSIVQLVHGPIASSRTIARCLLRASHVFYLKSTARSIERCLLKVTHQNTLRGVLMGEKFSELNNGLSTSSWPTQCQYIRPQILWSASLLKWKGLDFFIQAIAAMPLDRRPITQVCYIRPLATDQEFSNPEIILEKLYWHQQPATLDRIRAGCNIFISTSVNEPFGLAILEAMAAGHCVVIPDDNAHWAQILCHDVNCIKYQTNNLQDLTEQVLRLSLDLVRIAQIGARAQQVAHHYRSDTAYANVRAVVLNSL